MNDTVFNTMMELCCALGAAKYHQLALTEDEALLYMQLCRTITKQAKINEAAIDEVMKNATDSSSEDQE